MPASKEHADETISYNLALFLVTAMAMRAQTFATVYDFNSPKGSEPWAGLVQGIDGSLYGATSSGGAHCSPLGCGTIFKITPTGAFTTVYDFCAKPGCADGKRPIAAMVLAANGDLYGTTYERGANGAYDIDAGTVFRLTPDGAFTTVHSFCAQTRCADGATPSSLMQAADGNFYGTAEGGGTFGYGIVFKMTRSGRLTTLYSFCPNPGCADGSIPANGLIQAANGNLYGMTITGGGGHCDNGCGTLFQITLTGTLTTIHSFCPESGCLDGAGPNVLIQGSDGDLYGATGGGGTGHDGPPTGGGTFFKVSLGALTTLYNFCSQSGCVNGAGATGLVQGADGNFYGVTDQTIFKVTPDGALTTLHTLCPDGACQEDSAGPLFQATNGDFYGVTASGGTGKGCGQDGCGTIFRLSAGLGPFVEPVPVAAKAGATVRILGNNLTGVTSVTFGGAAAAFEVVSSSEITATVPAGASSGSIHVFIPGGTLTSNVPFRLLS